MSSELRERIREQQMLTGEEMVMDNLARLGFGTAPVVDPDREFVDTALRVIRESYAEHGDTAEVARRTGCPEHVVRTVVNLEPETESPA